MLNFLRSTLPAYLAQMPIWTLQQANPSHILFEKSHQVSFDANQYSQHHSQYPPQVLSPRALQSSKENTEKEKKKRLLNTLFLISKVF